MKLSAAIVLVSCTLFLLCWCCSTVDAQSSCRMSKINQVYRDLELIRQMFRIFPQQYRHNFGSFLHPSLMKYSEEKNLVKFLLTFIELTAQFDQKVGGSPVVTAMKTITDVLNRDICRYLNETFGIPCEVDEMKKVLLTILLWDTVLDTSHALRDVGLDLNYDLNWMYVQYEKAIPSCDEKKKYIKVFGNLIELNLQETITECSLQSCDIS